MVASPVSKGAGTVATRGKVPTWPVDAPALDSSGKPQTEALPVPVVGTSPRWHQPIDRTRDGTEDVGGDVYVADRRVAPGVAQQYLDHAARRVRLQEMVAKECRGMARGVTQAPKPATVQLGCGLGSRRSSPAKS